MRIVRLIVILCSAVCLLSACDFFRKIAGRPLSADIEAKRVTIEAQKAAHQQRLAAKDSLHKHITDSLAALDSVKISSSVIIASRSLSQKTMDSLMNQYYVVIGAFGKLENAQKAEKIALSQGFDPILIEYSNGFVAVGVRPTDDLSQIYLYHQQVSQLYPDAWILNNK